MKTHIPYTAIAASLLLISCLFSKAQGDLAKHILNTVTATNGVTLAIATMSNTNTSDSILLAKFRKVAGTGVIMWQPKPQYLGRFTLYDAEGRQVAKTPLGASFVLEKNLGIDSTHMASFHQGSPPPLLILDGWTDYYYIRLPSPAELFKIEKPGNYKMVLEAQGLFRGDKEAVVFPPLVMKIIQPEKLILPPGTVAGTNVPAVKGP